VTTQAERTPLLRGSLADWDGALPLAWAICPRNRPLADSRSGSRSGHARAPAGGPVTIGVDRPDDGLVFIDRVQARGWHWVVRTKANSPRRFRDQRGREAPPAAWVRTRVRRPGQRWQARGQVLKDAGGWTASGVAVWTPGHRDRLVVPSALPPRWEVIAQHGRRPWAEPGVRAPKSAGRKGEASQGTDLQHPQVLLTAMAGASLVTLCRGIVAARARLAARAAHLRLRSRPAQPAPARASIFRLGLQATRAFLDRTSDGPICWSLPEVDRISWNDRWRHCQVQCSLRETVRP
jgi:hypothetical protein